MLSRSEIELRPLLRQRVLNATIICELQEAPVKYCYIIGIARPLGLRMAVTHAIRMFRLKGVVCCINCVLEIIIRIQHSVRCFTHLTAAPEPIEAKPE